MAINISSLVIKSEDFKIGKKTYTAKYTPELDDKFSDFLLKMGDLYKRIEDEDRDDDITLDEQRKVVRDAYTEMADNSKEFLEAALGKQSSDEIIRYVDNRTITLVKIAKAIFEAGQSDELKAKYGSNREQRRNKGND